VKRAIALFAALVLCGLVLGLAGRAPLAQTEPRVLDACGPDRDEIQASALPGVVEPGECPSGGREISDGPVSAVVPPPGRAVYAEVLTTSGAEELSVSRLPDGTIELDHVGEDLGEPADALGRAISDRVGCRSSDYTDLDHKVTDPSVTGRLITYNFKVSTTPSNIPRLRAKNAIARAAGNVFNTRNGCRMGDRVPVRLVYGGRTGAPAQAGKELCGLDDGRSVVAFGNLKAGILAAACAISDDRPQFDYDEVTSADIKINRADFRWTLTPGARTCAKSYDLEGVVTHEWGHVFGLGHVSESGNQNQTMSPKINGPCQRSERSLGRGDVLGLDGKYPND
jgi:hypothetical protein